MIAVYYACNKRIINPPLWILWRAACYNLVWLTLRPWKWSRYVLPNPLLIFQFVVRRCVPEHKKLYVSNICVSCSNKHRIRHPDHWMYIVYFAWPGVKRWMSVLHKLLFRSINKHQAVGFVSCKVDYLIWRLSLIFSWRYQKRDFGIQNFSSYPLLTVYNS